MEEEERKADEWERKNVRNKQMEEREGTVMIKGQIKVILQRAAQGIVWGDRVPKALLHFQKLWLSNNAQEGLAAFCTHPQTPFSVSTFSVQQAPLWPPPNWFYQMRGQKSEPVTKAHIDIAGQDVSRRAFFCFPSGR